MLKINARNHVDAALVAWALFGRPVDLLERAVIEASRNYIRRRRA